jgi:phosphoribosylcarboxyaminoimidazole (NCAIR) mutase
MNAKVSIIRGSKPDGRDRKQQKSLDKFNIPFEVLPLSAHRVARKVSAFAKKQVALGSEVIIAGGGCRAICRAWWQRILHCP